MIGPSQIRSGSTAGHCFDGRPVRESVNINSWGRIGNEARNSYRECLQCTDFSNIALDDQSQGTPQIIDSTTEQGTNLVTREVIRALRRSEFDKTFQGQLCISTWRTQDCGYLFGSRSSYFDETGHKHIEEACFEHTGEATAKGDSGAPIYRRGSRDGRPAADAAGWMVSVAKYDNQRRWRSCFVIPDTVQRDQQLRVLTTAG